jgi:hypothetical protein
MPLLSIVTDLMTVKAFKAFEEHEWDAFAGAAEGSLIGYGQRYAFILTTETLTAIDDTGEYDVEVCRALPYGK